MTCTARDKVLMTIFVTASRKHKEKKYKSFHKVDCPSGRISLEYKTFNENFLPWG